MSDNLFLCKPLSIIQNKRLTVIEQDYICLIGGLQSAGKCTASNKYFGDYFGVSKQRAAGVIGQLRTKKIIKTSEKKEGQQTIERVIEITDKGIKESIVGVLRKPKRGTKETINPITKSIKQKEVYGFILNNNETWNLPEEKYQQYKHTYKQIDIEPELRKAGQWLIDNPTKRKTAKGMPRFLNSWLSNSATERTKSNDRRRNTEKARPFESFADQKSKYGIEIED